MSGGIYMNPGKCLACGSVYALLNQDGTSLDDGALMGTPVEFISGFFCYSMCAECQMDDVVDQWVEEHEDRRGH